MSLIPEITQYMQGSNGTHNRGFEVDGVRVLCSGEDDMTILRIAVELASARARCAEKQAEVDRVYRLNTELASEIPPKRPAQILSIGCVRFDEKGRLWLMSSRRKGWSAFGVILNDWDDLFRRYNVRVMEHGVDEIGSYWSVEAIPPAKEPQ